MKRNNGDYKKEHYLIKKRNCYLERKKKVDRKYCANHTRKNKKIGLICTVKSCDKDFLYDLKDYK